MIELESLLNKLKMDDEEKQGWLNLFETMTEEGQKELYELLVKQAKGI